MKTLSFQVYTVTKRFPTNKRIHRERNFEKHDVDSDSRGCLHEQAYMYTLIEAKSNMDTCVSFWETLVTSDGHPEEILYVAVVAFHQAISTFEKTYVSACCMMESN